MTLEKFCRGIGLDENLVEKVLAYFIDGREYARFQSLLREDKKEFLRKLEERPDSRMFALALYSRLAAEVYKEYRERGIDDGIYFDTFRDFTIWSKVCERKFGEPGLTECGWLTLPLELKIFRLGRLQFEPRELTEDIAAPEGMLRAGTKVLDVHIPEGEPLDDGKCEDAFRRAESFFGAEYKAYVCTSWLVSEEVRKLVPEGSNIAKFQSRFRVFDTIYPFRQAEERVFGEILEDASLYPGRTSLQKALKAYVNQGKDPGMGCGIIHR